MLTPELNRALDKANARLKSYRVQIEVTGKNDNISLRAYLPSKPGHKPGKQVYRESLKMRCFNKDNLRYAEDVARRMMIEVNDGTFDWRKWEGSTEEAVDEGSIGYYAQLLEQVKKPQLKPYTWRQSYEVFLETLPLTAPITEQALRTWVLEQNPNNNTRRKYLVSIARQLLGLAGLSSKQVSSLVKPERIVTIREKDLPTDEEIVSTWDLIVSNSPEWAMLFGFLATYGLRNHELFHLEFHKFPKLRVKPNTKTGERPVIPLHPEWVARFRLEPEFSYPKKLVLPPSFTGEQNDRLGRKITNHFRKTGLRNPYSYRHAWNARALRVGINSAVAAKFMGHSEEQNQRSYTAFFDDDLYIEVAERAIESYKTKG